MKCKQRINKFMKNYNALLEQQVKKLVQINDKKKLIRLENDIEATAAEYKDLYKQIKSYVVPYVDFMQKYEKNISIKHDVINHLEQIGK